MNKSHSKSKTKSNTKINTATSYVVSFILSIFITMISYMVGTYFGFFNKALLLDAMNKSSYYESVNLYTCEEAEDYAIPAGLDADIFKDVFTANGTYREGKAYLEATLNGENYVINTSDIRDRLSANIDQFLADNNIDSSGYDSASIDQFIDKVCAIYRSNLTVPYLSYYKGIKSMFSKVIMWGVPLLLVLSALAIFIIIKLHKWLHRALRHIAYSFLGAALMVTIMPSIVLLTKKYQYLNITPMYVNRLISRYIGQSLLIFLYTGFVLAAAGFIIITIIYYKRKSLMK